MSTPTVDAPAPDIKPDMAADMTADIPTDITADVEMPTAAANNQIVPVEPQPNNIETPPSNPETQPNKRRKKKSIVWEHFTIETVGAGCRRACCKQCKQSLAYSTGSKVEIGGASCREGG